MFEIFALNEVDKRLYVALRYLSDPKRPKLKKSKSEEIDDLVGTLSTNRLIGQNKAGNVVLTEKGLKELRELENHRRADWTLKIATLSLIISIISLIISSL